MLYIFNMLCSICLILIIIMLLSKVVPKTLSNYQQKNHEIIEEKLNFINSKSSR